MQCHSFENVTLVLIGDKISFRPRWHNVSYASEIARKDCFTVRRRLSEVYFIHTYNALEKLVVFIPSQSNFFVTKNLERVLNTYLRAILVGRHFGVVTYTTCYLPLSMRLEISHSFLTERKYFQMHPMQPSRRNTGCLFMAGI